LQGLRSSAGFGGRMHFLDKLPVHFLKVVASAAISAAKALSQCKHEFNKVISLDSPGIFPVAIN